jgi:hypothetical protein
MATSRARTTLAMPLDPRRLQTAAATLADLRATAPDVATLEARDDRATAHALVVRSLTFGAELLETVGDNPHCATALAAYVRARTDDAVHCSSDPWASLFVVRRAPAAFVVETWNVIRPLVRWVLTDAPVVVRMALTLTAAAPDTTVSP